MPASNRGKKFLCYNCATKFYDLNRPEPICPKCHANQFDAPARRAKRPGGKRMEGRRAPILSELVEELPVIDEALDEEISSEEFEI